MFEFEESRELGGFCWIIIFDHQKMVCCCFLLGGWRVNFSGENVGKIRDLSRAALGKYMANDFEAKRRVSFWHMITSICFLKKEIEDDPATIL